MSRTDSRWEAGIGITEALKLLRQYDARCSKIADHLHKVGHYRTAYPGLSLSDTIINIKTAITSLLEGIGWTGIDTLGNALAKLEEEMKTHGLALPESVPTQEESDKDVTWIWDDNRKDHYYWSPRGYFVYHKGGKVKQDGTPYIEAGVNQTEVVGG
ncbi:hypothetical protein N0V83_001988 [Neocucurbitaria cava]|uniref:Uncharacterized protein n=1 Tax=Neocucurbitaria cava TaxID=798079 RepID=A0A9W8YG61_9PLEO|nr:hypothetical protein N0V83_001988 [Neocucurbitaria cava]